MIDLIHVFYEMIGGQQGDAKAGPEVRHLIRGRERGLILRQFRTAGQLREGIENLRWE